MSWLQFMPCNFSYIIKIIDSPELKFVPSLFHHNHTQKRMVIKSRELLNLQISNSWHATILHTHIFYCHSVKEFLPHNPLLQEIFPQEFLICSLYSFILFSSESLPGRSLSNSFIAVRIGFSSNSGAVS